MLVGRDSVQGRQGRDVDADGAAADLRERARVRHEHAALQSRVGLAHVAGGVDGLAEDDDDAERPRAQRLRGQDAQSVGAVGAPVVAVNVQGLGRAGHRDGDLGRQQQVERVGQLLQRVRAGRDLPRRVPSPIALSAPSVPAAARARPAS